MNGTISVDIQASPDLTASYSDISGSIEYHEKFHVYVNLIVSLNNEWKLRTLLYRYRALSLFLAMVLQPVGREF